MLLPKRTGSSFVMEQCWHNRHEFSSLATRFYMQSFCLVYYSDDFRKMGDIHNIIITLYSLHSTGHCTVRTFIYVIYILDCKSILNVFGFDDGFSPLVSSEWASWGVTWNYFPCLDRHSQTFWALVGHSAFTMQWVTFQPNLFFLVK